MRVLNELGPLVVLEIVFLLKKYLALTLIFISSFNVFRLDITMRKCSFFDNESPKIKKVVFITLSSEKEIGEIVPED